MEYYSPLPELDHLAKKAARYPFLATSPEEARRWQQKSRQALRRQVGFLDDPPVGLEVETLAEWQRDCFLERKVVLTTAAKAKMPVYILYPENKKSPLATVLAYHGHGPGVHEIVGLDEKGRPRATPPGYQRDFALELCRRGFLVAAPEIAGFGARQARHTHLKAGQQAPSTCHQAATYAIMLGKSLLGLRLRDSMRLLDYLLSLPEVDPRRIGAMGISGGGMLAFFHAALDLRIQAIVLSGYFGNFRHNILALHHCTCNFVPGLLQIGEFDNLVGLLAPRPLLVEAGRQDPLFPIEGVRASFRRTQEIYQVFGSQPQTTLFLDEFPKGHEISGRQSYDFLQSQLTR